MRASINEALNQPAPPTTIGDMQAVIERVQSIHRQLGIATEHLSLTRDRVFGAPPEAAGDAAVGGGWGDLGVLNSALDVLEHEVGTAADLARVFGRL